MVIHELKRALLSNVFVVSAQHFSKCGLCTPGCPQTVPGTVQIKTVFIMISPRGKQVIQSAN